ncbi:MAG: hypothetical protein QXG00_02035 [Candidatus Woesearchaeota archaeon]
MALFAGKKPIGSPLEIVRAMKQQGYTNNMIIQTLQKDGYSSADIVDALNKSEMPQPVQPGFGMQQSDIVQQPMMQMPEPPGTTPSYSTQDFRQQTTLPQQQNYDLSSAEELIEAIIDEKWNELVKDINKIVDWKNKTENKITSLEQQFNDLKADFDKLHQAIIGKIGEYDKNILEVGSEIKAMENVFSKVLPVFTENVNELSRITQKMKKK